MRKHFARSSNEGIREIQRRAHIPAQMLCMRELRRQRRSRASLLSSMLRRGEAKRSTISESIYNLRKLQFMDSESKLFRFCGLIVVNLDKRGKYGKVKPQICFISIQFTDSKVHPFQFTTGSKMRPLHQKLRFVMRGGKRNRIDKTESTRKSIVHPDL